MGVNKSNKVEKLRVFSVFSGIGGFELGLLNSDYDFEFEYFLNKHTFQTLKNYSYFYYFNINFSSFKNFYWDISFTNKFLGWFPQNQYK